MRTRNLMLRLVLFMAIALVLSLSAVALAESVEARLQVQYEQQSARDMLELINAFRQGEDAWYWNEDNSTRTELSDLSAITYDYELEQVAMQRAAELAVLFKHERPNGESCFTAYPSMLASGENIAAGQRSAQAAFTSWQETDEPYSGQGHRRNMLSAKFNVIGIGHAIYNGTHYWVQVLGKKTSPNTAETAVETGVREMTVAIADTRVQDRKVEVIPEALELDIQQSSLLPTVHQSYSVSGGWPRDLVVDETLDVEWNLDRNDLVSISDGRVTALHVGSATLTSSDGNYSVPLSVNYISLDKEDTVVSLAVSTVRYSGVDQRPEVSVIRNGVSLALNTDFTLTYENNASVGTATVLVAGKGDYTGQKSLSFEILPCEHEWGEPIVNKSPSYEETGSQTTLCVKCGEAVTQTLPIVPTPTPVPTARPTPTPGPTPVTQWTPSQDGESKIELPGQLKLIDEGAFEGLRAEEIIIPDSVERIENRAFAESDLKHVYLPGSIEHIDENAFEQVEGMVVDTEPDSYAEEWAVERDYINTPDGNFEYQPEGDGCVILRYTGALDKVRIPPDIDGITVTAIADAAFSGCANVTEIILPDTLTRMGKYVFDGCTSLTRYTIPDSVTELPEGTFRGCTSLTEYLVPEHITAIGDRAFENCVGLRRFTVTNNLTRIGSRTFSGCASLEYILLASNLTEIGEDAFAGCDKLRIVAWRGSAGESYIKQNNFSNCRIYDPMYATYEDELLYYYGSDSVLVIPADLGLSGVHDRAFEGMGMMGGIFVPTSVTLPEGMTRIGHRAFLQCDQLMTVNLPQSLTSINSEAFEQCSMLTSISIPGNVEYIGDSAFAYCSALKSVELRENLSTIGASAFYNCVKLTSVVVPDTVTSIGSGAFSGCTALSSVKLPDGLTSLGSGVFMNCSALTDITLPASLKVVPGNAFYKCTRLNKVVLPEGLTTISNRAFDGCTALAEITIPASVTSIGNYAFSNCSRLRTVYGVPGSFAEFWAAETGRTFQAIE